MRWSRKFGPLLLGIWLIARGVIGLVPSLNFPHSGELLAILAIVAGVAVLMDR